MVAKCVENGRAGPYILEPSLPDIAEIDGKVGAGSDLPARIDPAVGMTGDTPAAPPFQVDTFPGRNPEKLRGTHRPDVHRGEGGDCIQDPFNHLFVHVRRDIGDIHPPAGRYQEEQVKRPGAGFFGQFQNFIDFVIILPGNGRIYLNVDPVLSARQNAVHRTLPGTFDPPECIVAFGIHRIETDGNGAYPAGFELPRNRIGDERAIRPHRGPETFLRRIPGEFEYVLPEKRFSPAEYQKGPADIGDLVDKHPSFCGGKLGPARIARVDVAVRTP